MTYVVEVRNIITDEAERRIRLAALHALIGEDTPSARNDIRYVVAVRGCTPLEATKMILTGAFAMSMAERRQKAGRR